RRTRLIEEELTSSVIGAFYEVYNALGFGFLEHVYVKSLERELLQRGHSVGREVPVPVMYKGHQVAHQRLDMIVDEKLIVETNRPLNCPEQPNASSTITSARPMLIWAFSSTSAPTQSSIDSPASNAHPIDPLHPLHPD